MSRSDAASTRAPHDPIRLMVRFYRHVLPEVYSQLGQWREAAEGIPDPELRKQAIASMTSKRFHCEGGSIYAVARLSHRHVLIPLIVAFQTISDYLDNLCDRSTSMDEGDFRRLHQSMLDAVSPSAVLGDYYAYRNEKEDGGYLAKLVSTCQSCICLLPSFNRVESDVKALVSLYCDLQVYKHIRHDLREQALLAWWERHRDRYPDLRWNEFAAATGSTLGVFTLFLAAADPNLKDNTATIIREVYFPYVCSLHILLDYLIDQEEDRQGGDLNFCSYYPDDETTAQRIGFMAEQARHHLVRLQHAPFHSMIIEGLLALYLSDPKVRSQPSVKRVTKQLMRRSPFTRLFFWINSIWIRKKKS